MNEVYNYLENILKLNSNDTCVVGVSAGPDSMALLHILIDLRKKLNFKIVVAHVNHKLRKESDEEAVFLENYCNKNKVLFEYMIINKYGDDNFHNEARNIRYSFYESLIKKYNANYLMTGHHGDDLIETCLMRITRGSSLKGYSGFSMNVDKGFYRIIRPLVFVTKSELEEFDKKKKIEYRIDKSNFKDKYTRNRYRMSVLPFLKEEDKDIHKKFIKFSKTLQEYDEYLENVMLKNINKVYKDGILDIDSFNLLDSLVQKRIIDFIYEKLYQDDLLLINDKHNDLFMKAINSKKANLSYNLPNNYILVKSYNKIYFKKNIDMINSYDIELEDLVTLPNGMVIEKLDSCNTNGNDILRLNSKDVVLPLRVRTRKDGDKMKTFNGGSKKIKDIFIDKKIPVDKRDSYPIVVDSSDRIVWIPNVKKSNLNCLKNDKCDIIFKCS